MKSNNISIKTFGAFLILSAVITLITFPTISAAAINDTFHINLQTTYSNGSIQNGTFAFVFNITDNSSSSCGTNVVYNYSVTKTTDSRGIVSIYLPTTGDAGNLSSLNYDTQYYLCYYRDGTLKDVSQLGRVPYSFRATQVNLSEVTVDSNLSLGSFNVSTSGSGFFGFLGSLASRITKIFAIDADISNNLSVANNFSVNGSTFFVDSNSGRVGIGTTSPSQTFEVNGSINISNSSGQIFLPYGSTTSPSISFIDTGGGESGIFYDNVNNALLVEITGSNRWGFAYNKIYSSGIAGPGLMWTTVSTTVPTLLPYYADENTGIGGDNSDDLSLITAGVEALHIDPSQRVGINISTPQNLLNVLGDANITGTFYGTNADFNGGWQNGGLSISNGDLYAQTIYVYNITSLNVTQQNLSIINDFLVFGNTELKQNLSVSGEANISGATYLLNSKCLSGEVLTTNSTTGLISCVTDQTLGGGAVTGNGDSGYIARWNSTSSLNNSLIFENGSNIGINITTPQNTLNVVGDGNFTTGLYVNNKNVETGYDYALNSSSAGSANWNANYSVSGPYLNWTQATNGTLLQWSDAYNGTLFKTDASNDVGNFNQTFNASTLSIWALTNRIGIGTTVPNSTLHVIGDANVTGNLYGGAVYSGGNPVLTSYTETDPYWGANYSTFLTHITWANAVNGTLLLTSTFNSNYSANDADYRSITNTSYYLTTNPFGFYNSTTLPESINYSNASETFVPYTGADANVDLGDNNFSVNSSTLFVDTNSGRVGIGTTSPLSLLHLNGTSPRLDIIGLINTNAEIILGESNAGIGAGVWYNGTSNLFHISTGSSGDIITNSSNIRFTIVRDSGKVGIGTTGPAAKLQIVPGSSDDGIVLRESDDGNNAVSILASATRGQIQIKEGGTTNVQFNAGTGAANYFNNGGNVGIGTTSPSKPLHVNGSTTNIVSIFESTDSIAGISFKDSDGENGFLWTEGSGLQLATTNGADQLVIDSTGKVGIGTASPNTLLEINQSGDKNETLRLGDASDVTSDTGIYLRTTGKAGISVGSNAKLHLGGELGADGRMVIDESNGNVGIGTTSPDNPLDVSFSDTQALNSVTSQINSQATSAGAMIFNTNDSGDYSALSFRTRSTSASAWLIANNWTSAFNGNLVFKARTASTSSSDIMTLMSSGNVGIGTTAPLGKLSVAGSAFTTTWNTTEGAFVYGGSAGIGNYLGSLSLGLSATEKGTGITAVQGTSDSNQLGLAFFTHPSATGSAALVEAMRIDYAGNVGIGTTGPGTKLEVVGDARLGTGATLSNDYGKSLYFSVDATPTDVAGIRMKEHTADNYGLEFQTYASGLSTKMTILGNGNVGIGTTSPETPLHLYVNDTSTTPAQFNIEQDGTGDAYLSFELTGTRVWSMGVDNSDNDNFKIAGSGADLTTNTRLTIQQSNGNVGIGTATPQNTLNVIGDGNFTGNLYSNGAAVLTSYSETDPKWSANYSARTGTGNVVFSTSPSLTTPTLGVATATTLDTGQGANVLYDMDQNVLTTSGVQFGTLSVDTSATSLNSTNTNTYLNVDANEYGLVIDAGFDSPDEPARLLVLTDADGTDDIAIEVRGSSSGGAIDNPTWGTGVSSANSTFVVFGNGATVIGKANVGDSYAMTQSSTLEVAGLIYASGNLDAGGGNLLDDGANFFNGGCSADQYVSSISSDGTINCAADSGTGTMSSFTLGATSGTNQTITNGNTAFLVAGTGITTTGAATDKVTIAATLGTSIDSSEIVDGTIVAGDLAPSSVNTTHVVDGSLTGTDIANGGIAAVDLAASSVNTTHIVDGTILVGDLANGQITSAKLTSDLGLGWANLTNYPSACSSSQTITTIGDTITCSSIAITESQVSGEIEAVTAGNGLTGGGTSGSVTLDVGAGTGISVAADSISATLGTAIEKGEIANSGTLSFDWADSEVSDTLTVDGTGTVTWAALTSYPTACSSSQYISVFGDTLTCGSIAISDTQVTDAGKFLLATGDTATGNYTFDTNTFFINANADRVGIGTTSPDSRLHILGAGASNPLLQLETTGTGNREFRFYISGAGANYDTLYLAANTASGGSTFAALLSVTSDGIFDFKNNNISGVDHIDANIYDPIYTIDGTKYATYLPGMAGGVKEEVTGIVTLHSNYTIDFNNLERGSNLWLFYQITDFGSKMENLQIMLTPAFDGRVWYEKNPIAKTLTIHGTQAGEVSYRMTANRFDWRGYDDNLAKTNSTGMILNGK